MIRMTVPWTYVVKMAQAGNPGVKYIAEGKVSQDNTEKIITKTVKKRTKRIKPIEIPIEKPRKIKSD